MSEKLDQILDALSKRLGVSKERIVELLVKSYMDATTRYRSLREFGDVLEKRFLRSDMTLDDLLKIRLIERFLGDHDVDINRLLALGMIRQLFQPDLTTLLILERMSSRRGDAGSGNEDRFLQYLIQVQQQNQQLMMQLMQLMFGKRYEEMMQEFMGQVQAQQEQMRKEFDEKLRELAQRMVEDIKELKRDRSELAKYLAELKETIQKQPQGAELLVKMLNQFRSLRDAVMEAAEVFGMKKEEIPVKPTGEIDWGRLLNRLFDLAGKYLEIQREIAKARAPPKPPAPAKTPPSPPPGFKPIKMEKAEEAKPETKEEKPILVGAEEKATEEKMEERKEESKEEAGGGEK